MLIFTNLNAYCKVQLTIHTSTRISCNFTCIYNNITAYVLRFSNRIYIFATMDITTSSLLLFSPTGTSKKVATAVADGYGAKFHVIDATYGVPTLHTFAANELVFVAVPVYGGKVAPLALQRLEAMRGDNTPVVLIVVYGNRAYGESLTQLKSFVGERGFVTVAAAAFIGEHSYSTSATPIAVGRPDMTDLAEARTWGKAIRNKMDYIAAPSAIDLKRLVAPRTSFITMLRFGVFIWQQQRKKKPDVKPVPITDSDKCKKCGKCARLCPTGAIPHDDLLHTHPDKCIKCCACVKCCPTHARTFTTPFAPMLSTLFNKRRHPVTIL